MRTILNVLLLSATCAGVAGCQVPECKLVLACDPPARETVYLTPTYYSPTDSRIMFAPDRTAAVPVSAPAEGTAQ
jgi:hypothetical protein